MGGHNFLKFILRVAVTSVCISLIYIYLIITCNLNLVQGQPAPAPPPPDPSPCENTLDDSFESCKPCAKNKWSYMVSDANVVPPPTTDPSVPTLLKCSEQMFFKKGQKCEGEEITDTEHPFGCFNYDPVTVQSGVSNEELIADGEVQLDPFKSAIGFSIPEMPFFRFFLPPNARKNAGTQDDAEKWDIGNVGKYYINKDNTDGKPLYDTDFELFEWPGKTAAENRENLELITKEAYGCIDDDTVIVPPEQKEICSQPHVFIMLAFERPTSKFLNYPCNSVRGTHVVAYGQAGGATSTDLNNPESEPNQKIWLSYGQRSMHKEYIQPLYARKVTLMEMIATDPDETECLESNIDHLRLVLDFTFVTERLVLGMKCGIMLVQKIMDHSFVFVAARQLHVQGRATHFSEPINKISASVCCENALDCSNKKSTIAAYSYKTDRQPKDLKYLYVSFDLGDTFEKKIIAPANSIINLIKGIYGVYERWALYYKILEANTNKSAVEPFRMKELYEFERFDIWKQLNAEERETFVQQHAQGTGADRTKAGKAILRKAFCNKVKEIMAKTGYEKEKNTDFLPEWVKRSIALRYQGFKDASGKNITTHEECENEPKCKENFEEDYIVKEFLKDYKGLPVDSSDCPEDDTYWLDKTKVYTRKQNPDETFCLSIVSFDVINEEQSVLMLCKVGKCIAKAGGLADCDTAPDPKTQGFAVFEATVNARAPIVYPKRKSKRIIKCEVVQVGAKNAEPEIIRVPKSASIIIVNCKNVIYFSGNAGRTIFNSVFYTKKIKGAPPTAVVQYVRVYNFDKLTVPPAVALDPKGHSLLLTFDNYFAFGILNYNREFRLLTGEAFSKDKDIIKKIQASDSISIPWFTNSGQKAISLALMTILKSDAEYLGFYKTRPSMRLVELPINLYKEIVAFYGENKNIKDEARAKQRDFGDCNTYSFNIKPQTAQLDIGDSVTVSVSVTDVNPLLPLGIFTNEEQSVLVEAKASNRSRGDPKEIIKHDWDVTITALQHFKSEEESMMDAFFGAQYTRLYEFSSNIVMVNMPTVRCHVQPSGSVVTNIGCLGKIMVAHEDEFRPQCKGTFVNNFEYTLERNRYDPELARFWIENSPEFVKREDNGDGDLKVVYDYTTFGCPLEPYPTDDFSPDLRVLSAINRRNSTLGLPFNGSYILIEVFGAKGFTYKIKVGGANCKRKPQNMKQMVQEWMIRRRVFNITRGKTATFLNDDETKPDTGNRMFDGSGVNEHLNIWNRVNYQDCTSPQEDGTEYAFSDDEKQADYEIMDNTKDDSNDEQNKLKWDPMNRPKVFIFLAIAVANDGTLCNYFTWFGVSLPKAQELDDMWSVVCFLLFTFMWIFLVVFGYWCRKSYIRKAYINEARSERLKQAAWTVIYRYEKLLHENENKELESEITEFTRAVYEKEREKGYERMKQKDGNKDPKDKNTSAANNAGDKAPADKSDKPADTKPQETKEQPARKSDPPVPSAPKKGSK